MRLFGVLATVIVMLVVLSVAAIQFPNTNRNPPHVDAIVVLGALDEPNMAEAARLLKAGTSDNLVLSVADGEWRTLCTDFPPGVTVTCFDPDPPTTRGEAETIGQLAQEHGWRSLAVVTWTTHVFRSEALISRCFSGDLYLVDYPDGMSFGEKAYEQLYQTASMVKVLSHPGC